MQQSLYGKKIMDKLSKYFDILQSFRSICAQLPDISYKEHVEIRVLAKEMVILELPTVEQWKAIEKYGKTKYRLLG